jgi:hypothetical protein
MTCHPGPDRTLRFDTCQAFAGGEHPGIDSLQPWGYVVKAVSIKKPLIVRLHTVAFNQGNHQSIGVSRN